MKATLVLCLLLALVAAPLAAQTGVTVKADKKTDFSTFKTYAWEGGWKALDRNVHQQIVDAVDRELAGLGLEKKDKAPADVLVTYATLRRTDVDLKAEQKASVRPTYEVGTLVVLLLDPATRKELFKGRGDKPILADAEKIKPVVDGVVAEIFAKYPTRARK